MRLARALLVVALAWGPGCGEESGLPEGALCEPGATVFCRCPGGDAGEKRCEASGEAFGACEGCEERPDPSGGTGGGSSGAGGGNPGGAPLYRPCGDDSFCESNLCQFGYCTQPCAKVSDCEYPLAECVSFGGSTVCMPACNTAADCEPFGAPPSACGYASAIDNWGVTVCANWGSEHQLTPIDTDCAPFDHEECNLGYARRERVCSEKGLCTAGCFGANDCPNGASCSSDGSQAGACQ